MSNLAKPACLLFAAWLLAPSGWGQEVPGRRVEEGPRRVADPRQAGPALTPARLDIDDRIFIQNRREVPRVNPAKPGGGARQGARAGSWINVRIGDAVYRLTLEPPAPPEPPKSGPRDDMDEEPSPPAPPMARGMLNISTLERENFDRVLFDGHDGPSIAEHFDKVLRARLNQAARDHHLDGQQREKLRLAGLGDVKHFLDRVDAARAEFEAVRGNFRKAAQVLQQVPPLSDEFRRGPFGDDSLFAKTLRQIRSGGLGPR